MARKIKTYGTRGGRKFSHATKSEIAAARRERQRASGLGGGRGPASDTGPAPKG